MTLQTTGSAGLAPEMKVYYDRRLLTRALPMLLHSKFAQRRGIPRRGGKTIEFRKFATLGVATTALTEGTPPAGQSLSVSNITATVEQYGGFVSFSDLVATTTIDPLLEETTDLLAEQAAESIDELVRDVLVTGTNVQYSGSANAARTDLASGDIIDVVDKPEINGIRAEFPNNKTETWIGPSVTSGTPRYGFGVIGPSDPYEPYTALQDSTDVGYQDGNLIMSAEPGSPDTRPNALLPFAAPTDSASTVSGELVNFYGKSAIGFTNSGATNANFETSGQAWLELDFTALFLNGDGIPRWTFHTGGTSTTISGTFTLDNHSYNRAAVSYDPVNHVAAATVDGNVVASVPYDAASIKYAGVEGTLFGHLDNFTVRTGTV